LDNWHSIRKRLNFPFFYLVFMVKEVTLLAVCPHCNEAVQISLNKREAKVIFKSFRMNKRDGDKYREENLKKCRPQTAV